MLSKSSLDKIQAFEEEHGLTVFISRTNEHHISYVLYDEDIASIIDLENMCIAICKKVDVDKCNIHSVYRHYVFNYIDGNIYSKTNQHISKNMAELYRTMLYTLEYERLLSILVKVLKRYRRKFLKERSRDG